jgi:hypothetical protein
MIRLCARTAPAKFHDHARIESVNVSDKRNLMTDLSLLGAAPISIVLEVLRAE